MTRPKQSPAGLLAYIDMMLCAVGCGLILFAVYLCQPRAGGGGWDDRPLVVVVRATGPPGQFADLRCRWALRQDGRPPDDDPAASGVTAVPASRESGNGDSVVLVVPEAEFGRWVVSVTPTWRPRSDDRLFLAIERSRILAESDPVLAAKVARYSALYARFRELPPSPQGQPSAAAVALAHDLHEAAHGATAIKFETTGAAGDTGERYPDAGLYLQARLWTMLRALERAGVPPTPPWDAHDALMFWVSARPEKDEGRSLLRAAVRGEAEWVGGEPGRKPPDAWAELEPLLTDTRHADRVPRWRAELVRLRASMERGIGYDGPRGVRPDEFRQEVFDAGGRDPASKLVAAELVQYARRVPRLRVEVQVIWGDRRAVAGAGGPEVGEDGTALDDLGADARGREQGLFEVYLERDRPPRVGATNR